MEKLNRRRRRRRRRITTTGVLYNSYRWSIITSINHRNTGKREMCIYFWTFCTRILPIVINYFSIVFGE
jgi:hypothetical protein